MREPFRLARLRDLLLSLVAMFTGLVAVFGAVVHHPYFALSSGAITVAAIALGRHPRMVLANALGVLVVPGLFKSLVLVALGQWRFIPVLIGCALVVAFLMWFLRARDWRYGSATRSDKLVVAGIFTSIPIG